MQRRVSDEPLPVRVDKACTLQGGVGFQTQRVRREGHSGTEPYRSCSSLSSSVVLQSGDVYIGSEKGAGWFLGGPDGE